MARPLETRLTEYRDSLTAVAEQLDGVVVVIGPDQETEALAEAARLYRLIAADLSHILDAEELRPFLITGEVRPPGGE